MHVSDAGAGWQSSPSVGGLFAFGEHALQVHAIACHLDPSFLRPVPGVAWTIPIQLKPDGVRVGDVEGLAHQVISLTNLYPRLDHTREELAQFCPPGEKNSDVLNASELPRLWLRPWLFSKDEERCHILSPNHHTF